MATYHQSPIQDSGGNTNFIPSTSNNTDKSLISLYWSDVNLKPSFCNVATSGDYNDLTGKPWLFNGSSKIYNYPLNSYIGIGTNNPNYNLDVYGNINFTGSLNQNGSEFKTSQWTTVNNDIYYNLGNVGIGKSTGIDEKLDINGNLRIAGNIIPSISSNYDLGSSNYKWKDLYLSGSSIYLNNFIISKNENSQINLKDTNNNFIGIKANEVSINSNNNSLKIQVNSNGFLNFNINNIDNYPVVFNNPYVYSNIILSNVFSNTSNSLNTQINSLNIDTLPAGTTNRFIINDTYNRNITFSGTLTSSNIITSNLSVIGDTTILNTTFYQTEQLQVVNDTTATSMIVKQMNVNNNLVEFYNNTTLNFLINSSGNVGIGYPTINNNYKVDINGGLNLSGASGEVFVKGTNISNIIYLKVSNNSNFLVNYNNLINRPSLATVATSGIYSDLTGTPFIISGNNAYSSFTGNLGIGTSIINNKLEVLGSINVGGASGEVLIKGTNISNIIDLKINNTSNTLVNYNNLINRPSLATVATTGNYNDLIGKPESTGGGVSDFNLLMNSPFITSGNNIYTNSNVGIGKTNPSYALDVIGDININGSLRISNVPLPISTYSNTNITASNGYFSYINNNNSFGYYTFLTSGSITFPQATNCDLLVVGAGGNGGTGAGAGGGGAGEVIYYPNYPFSQGTSNIRIGYSDFNINNRISRILFNSSSIITALGGGNGGTYLLYYSTSGTGTVSSLTAISGSQEQYLSFTAGTITLTLNSSITCDILVVGGGGGGSAGGGGAGQVIYQSNQILTSGTYTITIGGGGAGKVPSVARGDDGNDTFIQLGGSDVIRARKGGGGAPNATLATAPTGIYGSTGGCGHDSGGNQNTFPSGTVLGYVGAPTTTRAGLAGYETAGGGGGAGGAGQVGVNGNYNDRNNGALGGAGGIGIQSSITGVATYYGGGGAGGTNINRATNTQNTPPQGGLGGGGNGSRVDREGGANATANSGGGGGGSDWEYSSVSGNGGSGVVIIRYRPVVEQPPPSEGRVASTTDLNNINDPDADAFKKVRSSIINDVSFNTVSNPVEIGSGGFFQTARTYSRIPALNPELSFTINYSSYDTTMTTSANFMPTPTYLFAPPASDSIVYTTSYFRPRRYNPSTGDFIDTNGLDINLTLNDVIWNNRTPNTSNLPSSSSRTIRGEFVGIKCPNPFILIAYSFTANLAFENLAPGAWFVLGRRSSSSGSSQQQPYKIIDHSRLETNGGFVRQPWSIYQNTEQKKRCYIPNNTELFDEYLFVFPKLAETDIRANINYGHQLVFKRIELFSSVSATTEV